MRLRKRNQEFDSIFRMSGWTVASLKSVFEDLYLSKRDALSHADASDLCVTVPVDNETLANFFFSDSDRASGRLEQSRAVPDATVGEL